LIGLIAVLLFLGVTFIWYIGSPTKTEPEVYLSHLEPYYYYTLTVRARSLGLDENSERFKESVAIERGYSPVPPELSEIESNLSNPAILVEAAKALEANAEATEQLRERAMAEHQEQMRERGEQLLYEYDQREMEIELEMQAHFEKSLYEFSSEMLLQCIEKPAESTVSGFHYDAGKLESTYKVYFIVDSPKRGDREYELLVKDEGDYLRLIYCGERRRY
jgi:hypothetical protein